MEQAGLANCVSVPDGAPQKVSSKELPSPDKVYIDPEFFLPHCILNSKSREGTSLRTSNIIVTYEYPLLLLVIT